MTALGLIRVLDVLKSTSPRPTRRAPCPPPPSHPRVSHPLASRPLLPQPVEGARLAGRSRLALRSLFACGAVITVIAGCAAGFTPPAAELVLMNGRVYTFAWGEPARDGTPADNAPFTAAGGWQPDASAVAPFAESPASSSASTSACASPVLRCQPSPTTLPSRTNTQPTRGLGCAL